jgi:drug/metabolite transporter (DMT)-like permease
VALAGVCFFWGTVYLAIRIALESFPPTLLMGVRFLSAGVVILLVAAAVRARMPSRREFAFTSLYGVITLGLGIGTLFFAIQWIPSGLAAMLTTTSPFWMVGVEALLPGGDRPSLPTVGGMLIGLAGTLLLVVPDAIKQGLGGSVVLSFFVLQLGCAGFALGSVLERRHDTTTHPIINGAVQELATGAVFLIPALFLNQPVKWDFKGLAAILYLILIGGVAGYSAFLYSMKHLPVSLVSVYTYVNPVVAVIVGSLIYKESFRALDMVAMLVIFAGVGVVKRYSGRLRAEAARDETAGVAAGAKT